MKIASIIAATALLISACIGQASACQGNEVVYQERFESGGSSWGSHPWMKFERGKLIVTPDAGTTLAVHSPSGSLEDYDVCVDVVQRVGEDTGGYASLLFWSRDAANYYTFDVSIFGHIRISRLQNNSWLVPVPWKQTRSVSPGSSVNTLRVRTLGNRITVFVNGVEAASLQAQRPSGGSLVGVMALSPGASRGVFEFDNFTVTRTKP
jgi:hypothetical protein